MNQQAARERIEALRTDLRRHDRLYFVEHRPEISDQQYDALMHELRALEAQFPELVSPDSPTQRVGEQPLEGFAHVQHAVPMRSIDNTYSPEDLRKFDERVGKGLETASFDYVVDPKIDGVAVTLRYEGGRLALGATRGDGRVGDDITQNLKAIRSVPLRLAGSDWPRAIDVRGEVYWPRRDFAQTNERLIAEGKPPFANPRNATAGTLKQLDPRIVAQRGLAFMAHGFGEITPLPVEEYWNLLTQLREWGVPTNPHTRRCASIDEVLAFVAEWESHRHQLDYETDGLVIKVNRIDQREQLGYTAKAPRWCIAYKYAAEQAHTRVVSVDLQVGKLGTITPVANLEPVQLAGTTVKRASLHNFDQVRRLGLHEGDRVTVEKAGEIIPQVVAVDPTSRPTGARPVAPPTACPVCGRAVRQDEGGVYLRCINPACPAQRIERLKFFCGRNQMDIEGAGAVLVETLVRRGLVQRFADLYRLSARRDELLRLERMGEKSVDNLLRGIERSKRRPLARVLAALNVRHVGSNTAEILASRFETIDSLAEASKEDLQAVEGVGPEVAAAVHDWLHSAVGRETIAELRAVGVNLTQPREATAAAATPLAGKTVVVTGTLAKYGRKEIEALIKKLGGKSTSSVSKNTDYLIAGAAPGSKLEKARKLGVAVLDEADFEKLARS